MINFAIIGTGWIGGIHAQRLQQCAGATLACVFDVNPEASRVFAERHGCQSAASLEEACERADAVIIASSTTSHKEVALVCIAAGKPFLMEKPVAHDLDSAIIVRDAAHRAGVVASVGFNRRFDARYTRIREAVATGQLGRLESLRFTVKTATPPSPEFLKSSGGLFGEFGIHFFDLARWISGEEPVEVFATGSTLIDQAYADIGQIDTGAVIVRMQSGALFQLDIGWRATYGHDERLDVFGSKGVLTSGDPAINLVLADDAISQSNSRTHLPDWFERFDATYLTELSAFVYALNHGILPSPSLHDGVVAQTLVEAAYKSIAINAPIRLA
ncbi:Gfo/Idh/MocA family protein [Glaciimonas sp. GNP009]